MNSLQKSTRRIALDGARAQILAALALVALPAAAQTASRPTDRPAQRVLITGSAIDDRFGENAREPSSTTTISGRKLEAEHADNLIQVLKAIPGVTIDTSGGDDLKIKLRGVENQRYMGVKNGVPHAASAQTGLRLSGSTPSAPA